MSARQYELVVFGASGYTGKLTAEHVAAKLPTDLTWALAGRSQDKLETLAAELKSLNPDRIQPGIEICALNDADLDALAKKTKLIIATVGPYAQHGEHAFKACANNGTHYLDVTGESPFVKSMIEKYESKAKETGAIMIPEIGIESAPPDLVTWSLVQFIKENLSAPTAEVVVSMHEMSSKPSGGTLATILSFMEHNSLKEIRDSMVPYAISPIPGPTPPSTVPLMTRILGVRSVRDLGLLTSTPPAAADRAIVHRSWGQLHYGPNFQFHEYLKTRNYLTGIIFHFALIFVGFCLAIPPFRSLAKGFVYAAGDGPTKEESKNDRFEYRGIGIPDTDTSKRAFCKLSFDGSLYAFTGISAAEAAISILRDDHKLGGGVYTPAGLGLKFIQRLESAGLKVETKLFEN